MNRTSPWRVFATARPSLIGGPVLPIDPAEQRALDEIRRRREARKQARQQGRPS